MLESVENLKYLGRDWTAHTEDVWNSVKIQ